MKMCKGCDLKYVVRIEVCFLAIRTNLFCLGTPQCFNLTST